MPVRVHAIDGKAVTGVLPTLWACLCHLNTYTEPAQHTANIRSDQPHEVSHFSPVSQSSPVCFDAPLPNRHPPAWIIDLVSGGAPETNQLTGLTDWTEMGHLIRSIGSDLEAAHRSRLVAEKTESQK